MSYFGRRRYFAADRAAGRAIQDVAGSADAGVRADALRRVAQCERSLAAFSWAFPDAAGRDEDGHTLAESHTRAACLVDLVAATERPPTDPTPYHPRVSGPLSRVPEVAAVLSALCATGEPWARAELVLALHATVVDHVGGQAAEALCGIAAGYYQLAGLSWPDACRRVWPHYVDGEENTP